MADREVGELEDEVEPQGAEGGGGTWSHVWFIQERQRPKAALPHTELNTQTECRLVIFSCLFFLYVLFRTLVNQLVLNFLIWSVSGLQWAAFYEVVAETIHTGRKSWNFNPTCLRIDSNSHILGKMCGLEYYEQYVLLFYWAQIEIAVTHKVFQRVVDKTLWVVSAQSPLAGGQVIWWIFDPQIIFCLFALPGFRKRPELLSVNYLKK